MTNETDDKDLPGYPIYPAGEDIYNNAKEEKDIDPEDVSKHKSPNEDSSQKI